MFLFLRPALLTRESRLNVPLFFSSPFRDRAEGEEGEGGGTTKTTNTLAPKLVFPHLLILAAGRGRTECDNSCHCRIKREVDERSEVALGH